MLTPSRRGESPPTGGGTAPEHVRVTSSPAVADRGNRHEGRTSSSKPSSSGCDRPEFHCLRSRRFSWYLAYSVGRSRHSEQFRFAPRICSSVQWQPEHAGIHACYLSNNCDPKENHHERAGCRGETGLGFRLRVGHTLFDPGSPGHASVGIRSGLKHGATGWQLARNAHRMPMEGSAMFDMERRAFITFLGGAAA